MGVSFKVSKTGHRYRPKPVSVSETDVNDVSGNSKGTSLIGSKNDSSSARKLEGNVNEGSDDASGLSSLSISENEVSFTLNLYLDGYFIGKPSESEASHQAVAHDSSKVLHPYNRTSETLFSAIESGRLPGDILDDMPSKYVNGTLVCEVRDYRRSPLEQGFGNPSSDGLPIVNRIRLCMSLENVVKDIPLISDNSWTYGDLMEVESRILKALQPQLCLDPTPKLDRLCKNPVPTKLNLSLTNLRRKRLRQTPEVTITSNNSIHGKKVCIDHVPESSNSRIGDSGIISANIMPQNIQGSLTAPNNMLAVRARSLLQDGNFPGQPLAPQQPRYQMVAGTPRSTQDQGSGSLVNVSGASAAGQEMLITYVDNVNSGISGHGKRDNQETPMSPLSSFAKRQRVTSMGPDLVQQQQLGPHMDSIPSSDMSWKQPMGRGLQYANTGIQKYPQQMFEGLMNQNSGLSSFSSGQPAMRFTPKEEQFEIEKLDGSELNQARNDMQIMESEIGHLDPHQSRLQPRIPQHLMRSNFTQAAWNGLSQDARKEEQIQKRKSGQSPRVSAGALAQSPLSSKSGELSSGSVGPHFGAVAATSALGPSQKEKSTVTSVAAVGGTPSLVSSPNDSLQRQHQAQVAAKRRSNSLPKTPVMSGVGSPASVSNISAPLNANSPSVGTPPMADQTILERFAKIEMVTMRHQLNCKKSKVENFPGRKPHSYSPQLVLACLSGLANNEDLKDESAPRQLSKSVVGGSMNICKMRVMNFLLADRTVQGNIVPRIRTRMVLSQKPSDGTVAMHYGDIEDVDVLSSENYLPTLPNTHFADLLAAEFCSQMNRDGYLVVEDQIQLKPTQMNIAATSQGNASGIPPNTSAVEQFNDTVSGQVSNEVKPTISGNPSVNSSQSLLPNARMLPPGNPQAVHMSQGLLSGVSMPARQQQVDSQSSISLQQQQQPQLLQQQQQQQQNPHALIQQQLSQVQRSPMVLSSNSHSHLNAIGQNSNMQLGNPMVNKPSNLSLQLLQQQHQQHQQHQQQQQQQLQPQQQQQQQQQPPPQHPQMQQRKMMMGLGTPMGVGNMGNNMVGLGCLGNTMGIGGTRGIGGPGISGPMAAMSSVGQNPMNVGQTSNITNAISQQIGAQISPVQAAAILKFRMAQSRGMPRGLQAGIAGMPGTRHPGTAGLSMLGQALNRANMNPMQRSVMGSMGPPSKMIPGMNVYINQPQQLQLQQQQQQQQQLQQQQQQPQQQESTSSLQGVVSPSQVGSPSPIGVPQLNQQSQQQQQQQLQQPSPQQMNQRTPMSPQISSGAMHAMSAGNPEACPPSPQLSSQTLGSVGSITNSPMELQGVNKSNSASNA